MSEGDEVAFRVSGKPLSLKFTSAEDHIAKVIRETSTFYEAEMLADARSR